MKVLIVDDEVTSRYILRLALTRVFGATTTEAQGAREALQLLGTTEVDLLFLDVHMPEMSGLEMLRQLRHTPRFAKLPVMMLTTETDAEAVREALSLGVLDYLVKPLSADAISERVAKTLEKLGMTGKAETKD